MPQPFAARYSNIVALERELAFVALLELVVDETTMRHKLRLSFAL